MPVPLPNLDTRRWADLVDEGRSLIPRHAPEWTDHNIHDPGITLIELFAWVVDQLIYRTNRIPERHIRKFLSLAGYAPEPPHPATVLLHCSLVPGTGALDLPAGLLVAAGEDETSVPFQTVNAVTLRELELVALQTYDGSRFIERTVAWRDGLPFAALGDNPMVPHPYDADRAPALYLALDHALPVGEVVTFVFRLAEGEPDEGRRLHDEADRAREACRPWTIPCSSQQPKEPEQLGSIPLLHHDARVAWDYWGTDAWHTLSGDEIEDTTRALTLDGTVSIRIPGAMGTSAIGAVTAPHHYIRCHLGRGCFDAPPVLTDVVVNGVSAVQSLPVWSSFPIAAGTVPVGAIIRGDRARLTLRFNGLGAITTLVASAPTTADPGFLVLDYVPPTAVREGLITLPLVRAGRGGDLSPHEHNTGTGLPGQSVILRRIPEPPDRRQPDDSLLLRDSLEVRTIESAAWVRWQRRDDLDASGPLDSHYCVEPISREVRFGNGARGRVPPQGCAILAGYALTLGVGGNVSADRPWSLFNRARVWNRALLGVDLDTRREHLSQIRSRHSAAGGAPGEDLDQAARRAADSLWAHERLVELCAEATCETLDQVSHQRVMNLTPPERAATLSDFERLALSVPGTRVRRARAWADLDPRYPCAEASGRVALVIVPELPAGRPTPSAGLRRIVRLYLDQRRVLCTRLSVVRPTYVDVSVRVTVQAEPGAQRANLEARIRKTIERFLHPLMGGPDSRGWPFGRDVYRSEVLALIDRVPGVDYVTALELGSGTGRPQCGNICLSPLSLVASGQHQIEVVL